MIKKKNKKLTPTKKYFDFLRSLRITESVPFGGEKKFKSYSRSKNVPTKKSSIE